MKNFLKWTGILLGGLICLTLLTGLALYSIGMKKLTRSYPNIQVEKVNIPRDADAISRGEHIATIWTCTKCHGDNLSGTLIADDAFLGTIPATNLTSGDGGIAGSYTEADWIRAIRHGVKPNGRVEIMMNNYSTMSEQDLGDLIAYLKQIPPVASDHPTIHFGAILPVLPTAGYLMPAAEQINHDAPRPADPVPGATIEYGSYLSVLCIECHNSNLGRKLEKWDREEFIRAMQTGVLPDGKQIGSTMRKKTFSELNDTELTALWLYYQNLYALESQK